MRRRFAWARRQGRPAWLWPDVAIEAWRGALQGIEGVIAAILAGEQSVGLEGEPDAVGLAGYTSGMGPLLGLWREQGRLRTSQPLATVLARHLAHNRLRAARMEAAAVEIVGRLSDRGLQALVLKGSHTGPAYFPEPGVRPASDIDLLVAEGDASAAEAVMQGCGLAFKGRNPWESSWVPPSARGEPRSLTYVHAEDPWSIDLHNGLSISVGRGTPVADLGLARPMASGGRWPVDRRAGVLDQPLLLLHLAAHAGAGWQNLTLLRQVELVLVIRQDLAAGRLSWPDFLDIGGRTGALGYAYPALRLADKLAPGLVPDVVLNHCAGRAPKAVRQAVERVRPATAQRIERNSVGEHFMWAEGWAGRLRLLASDILPAVRWPEFRRIYEERAWRLIRGRVSQ
ncbi:MAG: nucleotidyltransferase family protein [Caulobacteraceae bacterium]